MLTPVSVGNKSLADYTHLAGRPLIQEIRAAITLVLVALGAARVVELVVEDLELDQLPSGVPETMATIAHPTVPPPAGRRQPV